MLAAQRRCAALPLLTALVAGAVLNDSAGAQDFSRAVDVLPFTSHEIPIWPNGAPPTAGGTPPPMSLNPQPQHGWQVFVNGLGYNYVIVQPSIPPNQPGGDASAPLGPPVHTSSFNRWHFALLNTGERTWTDFHIRLVGRGGGHQGCRSGGFIGVCGVSLEHVRFGRSGRESGNNFRDRVDIFFARGHEVHNGDVLALEVFVQNRTNIGIEYHLEVHPTFVTTPEPAVITLVGAGLATLGAATRRKRRRSG